MQTDEMETIRISEWRAKPLLLHSQGNLLGYFLQIIIIQDIAFLHSLDINLKTSAFLASAAHAQVIVHFFGSRKMFFIVRASVCDPLLPLASASRFNSCRKSPSSHM